MPHPLALNGPESAPPGSDFAGAQPRVPGPHPVIHPAQRGAGWERSAWRPAGGAAALRAVPRVLPGRRGRGGPA